MTIRQLAAIAAGAPLGGFTQHLQRMKVYSWKDIKVTLGGIPINIDHLCIETPR